MGDVYRHSQVRGRYSPGHYNNPNTQYVLSICHMPGTMLSVPQAMSLVSHILVLPPPPHTQIGNTLERLNNLSSHSQKVEAEGSFFFLDSRIHILTVHYPGWCVVQASCFDLGLEISLNSPVNWKSKGGMSQSTSH